MNTLLNDLKADEWIIQTCENKELVEKAIKRKKALLRKMKCQKLLEEKC